MSISSVLFTGTHADACRFFVYVYKMNQKKYNVNQVNMIFLSGKRCHEKALRSVA
jgi:hypothetical protein